MRNLLALGVLAALVLGYPGSLRAQAPAAKGKISVAYIPGEAAVAVVARPRRVMASPEFAMLPVEVVSAITRKALGVDAADVEEMIAFAAPQGTSEPLMGAVFRLAVPVREQDLIPDLRRVVTEAKYAGRKYLRAPQAPFVSVAVIDEKTLLVAPEETLKRMLDAKPGDSAIHKLLTELDPSVDMATLISLETMRPILAVMMFALPAPPPAYREFFKVPNLLSAIEIKSTLGTGGKLELVLRATDEDAAGELDVLVQKAIALGREELLASLPPRDPNDLMAVATEKYLRRILEKASPWLRPRRAGDRLVLSVENSQLQGTAATTGILGALLVPAVQRTREAAYRTLSINQMRQLVIVMHAHVAKTRAFPARASFDKQGKPLLSWRVHMLPYIEQEALYKRFRLDEPWDSEHNKQLIPLIPKVYQSPTRPDTRTNYLMVAGPGSMFEATKGITFDDITDGSSNTIALVEVGDDRAVVWTKPEDLVFDPDKPVAALGQIRPEGLYAGFADGSIRQLRASIAPAKLLAYFTHRGGEVIRLGDE